MSKRHTRQRRMRASSYATASEAGNRLVIAAAVEDTDTNARTLRGVVVPFGQAGNTSGGRLTFAAGSLSWTDPRRVKLLREHDQRDVIGYATELVETDAGLVATFHVPEGENGDRALAEAANGLRDAFSVGVQLDDATLTRLRRSQGAPVAAAGALREVSQVSVPAFDDARLSAAGVADLIVSSWAPTPGGAPSSTGTAPVSTASSTAPSSTSSTTTAGAAGTTREDTPDMTRRQRLAALRSQDTLTAAEAAELVQLSATPDDQLDTELATAAATVAGAPEQPATASAGTTGPAVVPAVAGAARTHGSPSTYTFSGEGHSIVADLANAALRGDGEARERVERFNAELRNGNPASLAAFVTAAATRDDYDGAGTDVPEVLAPSPRPILQETIDARRPFISRLTRIPITNAQPFAVPGVTAEFDGVGEHTEGTPHRPAGTLTLSGGGMVQPTATSGAWEVSRELLDASNPALDRIAARAMLNDYRRKSESKLIALLSARAAQEGASVYNVDGVIALRTALAAFVNDDEEGADLVALSRGLLSTMLTDIDTTGRAQLPYIGAANAVGTMRAGYTGLTIDGVEMFRSAALDTAANLGAESGIIARSDGILWAESAVQQFRFDEVLGPGVVKLALWAYNGAAITDTADVQVIRAGADPTP